MSKAYINGKLIPEESAMIPLFDRSYLYGEGVFETMRAYNGRPAFCDMHYHRLKANCEKLKIELPLDEYMFEHAIIKAINANKLKDAYIRVTASMTGASIGIARPVKPRSNFTIFVKNFKGRPAEVYRNGAKAIIVSSVYADDPDTAEIKSTNYLTKMLARNEVLDENADEGLFQNRDGLILEGTATNLFLVSKGRLFTPPLTDGCLPGVTRWVVMGLADSLEIKCKESHVVIDDLKMADEIFLTGSTSEILPISTIVGITKKKAPGPVTLKLTAAYKELI